jgi:LysM repeat protein
MSRHRLTLALVVSGLALSPAWVAGQGAPQTHTVKKGDTLWDLAAQYLGDPFRWPEIYRRNTETVKDPNLIYPDQVLVIAGDVAPTPGTPADAPMVTPPGVPAQPGDSMARPPEAPGGAMGAQQEYVPKPMTIFNPDRFKSEGPSRRTSLDLTTRASAVRPGDFKASPILWDAAGYAGAGTLGTPIASNLLTGRMLKRPMQPLERVFVDVPAGAAGQVGEEYIVFKYGPLIEGRGRVIVPVGVVKLTKAPENGRGEALLTTKYEEVFVGQHLMPAERFTVPEGTFPSRVEFGTRTTLLWMRDEPVLATTGQYVILSANAADGLVPGDQVTLQRELGMDAKGSPLPAEDVAILQVTRVTRWGASAMVIAQTEGLFAAGMAGRVTAKMP